MSCGSIHIGNYVINYDKLSLTLLKSTLNSKAKVRASIGSCITKPLETTVYRLDSKTLATL